MEMPFLSCEYVALISFGHETESVTSSSLNELLEMTVSIIKQNVGIDVLSGLVRQ